MTKLTMKYGHPSAVLFLSAALMGTAAAQMSSSPIDPNNAVQVGSSGDAERNKQLLEELRLMRERMAAIEAEKGLQAVTPTTPSAYSAPVQATAAGTQERPSDLAVKQSVPDLNDAAAVRTPDRAEPFAFADFTWLNGNPRTIDTPYATKFFTPEIRTDVSYIYDFNKPADDTIGGSAEVFRHNEFQITQLGVGGDFHVDHVHARLMTQFGLYSQTQPRNDPTPSRGQWNLGDAYRYLSEAYGGYHFDAMHGVNVDAGIFMSYIGLFSFYNFYNWAYQPSYVSSNTPFFFNGARVQLYPTNKFKIEGWFINGWQSYGKYNSRPGLGAQFLYRPTGWLSIVGNQYGVGADTLGNPGRIRYHTDESVQVKYYDRPHNFLDKMAVSVTGDLGCEHGGGVSCGGNSAKGPKQSFIGYMVYNRFWFAHDKYAVTLGGGQITSIRLNRPRCHSPATRWPSRARSIGAALYLAE
jgi:hypothetical protein